MQVILVKYFDLKEIILDLKKNHTWFRNSVIKRVDKGLIS